MKTLTENLVVLRCVRGIVGTEREGLPELDRIMGRRDDDSDSEDERRREKKEKKKKRRDDDSDDVCCCRCSA